MDDLRCFITDFPLESENDYFKLVITENLLCCIVARTIFQRINEINGYAVTESNGFTVRNGVYQQHFSVHKWIKFVAEVVAQEKSVTEMAALSFEAYKD